MHESMYESDEKRKETKLLVVLAAPVLPLKIC